MAKAIASCALAGILPPSSVIWMMDCGFCANTAELPASAGKMRGMPWPSAR